MSIVLAVLIVSSAVISRRLAWDRFEEVVYESRPAFVIASKGAELLLYTPSRPDLGTIRVRRDDAALVSTGRSGLLVEP
jgi:hypothetical protein